MITQYLKYNESTTETAKAQTIKADYCLNSALLLEIRNLSKYFFLLKLISINIIHKK